jgi:mono/diheme cytochrome c family protein
MSASLLLAVAAASGWATGPAETIAQGRAIYAQACAQCHGQDGRGNPEWESEVRPIELTDCGTTAEPTELWEEIVRSGGASRGLSSVMPAYGEAYSAEEIAAVVAYLRTFCPTADAYPPGDLNFRRLLKTGKAFPEAELVLRASHRPERGEKETEIEVLYENRLGPRFQYEFVLPLRAQAPGGEGRGLADVELEAKYVLAFSRPSLSILSAGAGLVLPTGRESRGLGSGTAVFEPFLSYGKAWGRSIVQAKVGAGLPVDTGKADRELKYAVAFSQALGPRSRAWTPAVEWVGAYNTRADELEHALWLEASRPLNRLGHVIASVGVQVPIRPGEAPLRLEAYVLWDFGDGPLWLGW